MPWVFFTRGFDERVSARCQKRRQAGTFRFVRRSVAKEAIRTGAAIACERPARLRSTYSGGVKGAG